MGVVGAFELSTTSILTGVNMTGAHSGDVYSVAQINANQTATASLDHTITVWNANNNTLVNTYHAHTDSVTCLAVLPGGLLASGSWDSTVRFWNMQTKTVATVYVTDQVNMMMWNPVKGYLVISIKNVISILNITSMTVISSFTTNKTYYAMDILLPSGDVILGGLSVDVYSLPSGSNLINFPLSLQSDVIRLLPDYVTVVVGQANGSMFLMNGITGATSASFRYHTGNLNMLAMTPDLLYLISGATDELIMLWQWSTMSLINFQSFNAARKIWSGGVLSASYTGKYIFIFTKNYIRGKTTEIILNSIESWENEHKIGQTNKKPTKPICLCIATLSFSW
jgi:WD40 repeat protein